MTPPAGPPVDEPRVEPPSPRGAPLEFSRAQSLDEYKAEVAHAVLHANAQHTFIGDLPPVLKAVIVLQLEVDRNGFPFRIDLFRSNGYKELEARAIGSVRASKLPRPNGTVTRGDGSVTFTETWLFREDGKFQIRTLAGPQRG
jgi:protein TonB